MQLVSYLVDGKAGFGVLKKGRIVAAGQRLGRDVTTLKDAIASGGLAALGRLADGVPDYQATDVEFLPVIPDPDKILCVGVNYLAHIKENRMEPPKYPWIFVRFANSVVGHGQNVVKARHTERFDFEGELAVVVGRTAHHVRAADALDYVAGYSCFNDASMRDFQRHTPLFTAGKNFYHSGAFGPCLVTPDEIPDPSALVLETRLNGAVMQHTQVSDLCFDVPKLIEYCSAFARLEPGDVIATGTPGGVGWARNPPVFMHAGDTVEVEISNIGVLRNTVVDE